MTKHLLVQVPSPWPRFSRICKRKGAATQTNKHKHKTLFTATPLQQHKPSPTQGPGGDNLINRPARATLGEGGERWLCGRGWGLNVQGATTREILPSSRKISVKACRRKGGNVTCSVTCSVTYSLKMLTKVKGCTYTICQELPKLMILSLFPSSLTSLSLFHMLRYSRRV